MPGPVQTKVSFFNLAQGATIAARSGFLPYQSGWPASNLRYAQQPFVPGKTQNRATMDTLIDALVAQPMEYIQLVNVNYVQAQLIAANDPTFATVVWATGVFTIGQNPQHRRYTHVVVQPGVAATRYLILRIAASLPTTDGYDYYSTGGMFIGQLTALPSDIRWEERPRLVEPQIDVPLVGGGTSRVKTGRPYVQMQARRLALVSHATPGTGDNLGTWLQIDELMRAYGQFAWYVNRGNPAEAFIFRKMNESEWPVHPVVSEDDLVLHEVIGP